MIVLHLPFPPSVNSANNYGRKGYYPSEKKVAFYRDANTLFLTQKRALRGQKVEGPFTYHIVLNRSKRRPLADGDNHLKYVLDFAQIVGLIDNDKLAEGGSWSWGDCEHGCMLSIHPKGST
jgi:Holliday junction resolvase RusA-like endonuclease